jgi:hypothetical protein
MVHTMELRHNYQILLKNLGDLGEILIHNLGAPLKFISVYVRCKHHPYKCTIFSSSYIEYFFFPLVASHQKEH